jgi:hypothetical protein
MGHRVKTPKLNLEVKNLKYSILTSHIRPLISNPLLPGLSSYCLFRALSQVLPAGRQLLITLLEVLVGATHEVTGRTL